MKTLSQLVDFYYEKLYKNIQQLEDERKKIKQNLIFIWVAYSFIFLVVFLIVIKFIGISDFTFFVLFVYIAGGGIIYSVLTKDYKKNFKENIIRPMIGQMDKSLLYAPQLCIPRGEFIASNIFSSTIDRFGGSDYVSGNIDGVNIKFSQLHVEQKDSFSDKKEEYTTVFNGLFIVADFHKNFKYKTVVLPDFAQKVFGDVMGGWLQSKNIERPELVKMDNVEFEKQFVVYGENQIEARYILTPSLMQKLLKFQSKLNKKIFLSFVNNKIYMAISYDGEIFEASVFKSLLKYEVAMQYIQTIYFAVGIVEELKLNQKIWKKYE